MNTSLEANEGVLRAKLRNSIELNAELTEVDEEPTEVDEEPTEVDELTEPPLTAKKTQKRRTYPWEWKPSPRLESQYGNEEDEECGDSYEEGEDKDEDEEYFEREHVQPRKRARTEKSSTCSDESSIFLPLIVDEELIKKRRAEIHEIQRQNSKALHPAARRKGVKITGISNMQRLCGYAGSRMHEYKDLRVS